MVESNSDEILKDADQVDVAFLVVGDPFGATTHTDLYLRARILNIPVQTLPNASILTAIGATGLSLYNFGQTTSMVFFTDSWRPDSFYDRLAENANIGLHSLILLDIKVKEPDLELLARTGRSKYDPPRYMTAAQCCTQMVEVEENRQKGVCSKDRLAVGAARVGSAEMKIVSGTLEELCQVDLGEPLHSVVLVGQRCHEVEKQFLKGVAVDLTTFEAAWGAGSYGQ